MGKTIEFRRHTANDGDALTAEGVVEAVRIGRTLVGSYDLVVSSGAHRATQAAACFLAGLGSTVNGGVVVDDGFRSTNEERWRAIYAETKNGDLDAFLLEDFAFVEEEAMRFAEAVRRVGVHTPDGGRTLVVGHSPMLEAAVWGVTQTAVTALGKGQGIVLVLDGGRFSLAE